MKDKLAIAIRVVNFVKTSATNTRLFNHLCKEMDSAYETLLFHTAVRWLLKGNMLGRVYDMREEVRRVLESHRKQDRSPIVIYITRISTDIGISCGHF